MCSILVAAGCCVAIALGVTSFVLSFLSDSFLVVLFSIYLLMEKKDFALVDAERDGNSGIAMLQKIDRAVKDYIAWKVILSLTVAVLVGVILTTLGVDLAPVFGVMAFSLNFLPAIGPVLSTFLPVPVLILQPDLGIEYALAAFFLPGLVLGVSGNFVEPIIFGDMLDLHAVTVLLGLILWASLWGVIGALLAVPILSVIKIALEQSSHPLCTTAVNLMRGRVGQTEADEALAPSRP